MGTSTGPQVLSKHVQKLHKNIHSFSDGQATVTDTDWDELSYVEVTVKPSGGPYHGGTFVFKIYPLDTYPTHAPDVRCLTPIFHPNITTVSESEPETEICVSLLDEWEETFGLEDCVQAVLFLMYEPNRDDPLNCYFSPNEFNDEEFERLVKASLRGEEVEGVQFPWNYSLEDEPGPGDARTTDQTPEGTPEDGPEVNVEQNGDRTEIENEKINTNTSGSVDDLPKNEVTEDNAQITPPDGNTENHRPEVICASVTSDIDGESRGTGEVSGNSHVVMETQHDQETDVQERTCISQSKLSTRTIYFGSSSNIMSKIIGPHKHVDYRGYRYIALISVFGQVITEIVGILGHTLKKELIR